MRDNSNISYSNDNESISLRLENFKNEEVILSVNDINETYTINLITLSQDNIKYKFILKIVFPTQIDIYSKGYLKRCLSISLKETKHHLYNIYTPPKFFTKVPYTYLNKTLFSAGIIFRKRLLNCLSNIPQGDLLYEKVHYKFIIEEHV